MAERKFGSNINMQGNSIVNVADPSAGTDAVNLNYLTNFVNQRQYKQPVRAASTANITLATPGASIDGVALSNGDRVLLKNQSTGSQNGIYVFNGAASTMTRATDADTSAEVKAGLCMVVTEGSTNADKEFLLTTDDPIILGTTALTFTLINTGGTSYSAGNGLALSGTSFSVKQNAGSPSIYIDSDGVAVAAEFAGNGTTITSGVLNVGAGTGIVANANDIAVDTSVVARKFSATVGDNSTTALVITHNLGSRIYLAQAQDASTGEEQDVQVVKGTNTCTFTFGTAPTTNSIVLVVIG